MRISKAVILVGGPGTRLRPLTDKLPKSMVPVLNKPVMEHTIAYLRQYGIEDIVLTLNYLPDAIRDSLGDGRRYGVNLIYFMEEEPLGTAGAIKNTEECLDDNPFLVLNGDVFTDLDLGAMIEYHAANRAVATISLHRVEDPSAYGVLDMEDSGRVKAFIEKPPREEAPSDWINAGTYILEPGVLGDIPAGQHYMVERGLFPGLLAKGEAVYGYKWGGYWLDMGRPENYYSLNVDLAEGRFRSPATADYAGNSVQVHPDTVIGGDADMTGAVLIDRGCRIGDNVRIQGPVVIGSGCVIEDNAQIEKSILWRDVSVGSGAVISRSIITNGVNIGPNNTVSDGILTVDKSAVLSTE